MRRKNIKALRRKREILEEVRKLRNRRRKRIDDKAEEDEGSAKKEVLYVRQSVWLKYCKKTQDITLYPKAQSQMLSGANKNF